VDLEREEARQIRPSFHSPVRVIRRWPPGPAKPCSLADSRPCPPGFQPRHFPRPRREDFVGLIGADNFRPNGVGMLTGRRWIKIGPFTRPAHTGLFTTPDGRAGRVGSLGGDRSDPWAEPPPYRGRRGSTVAVEPDTMFKRSGERSLRGWRASRRAAKRPQKTKAFGNCWSWPRHRKKATVSVPAGGGRARCRPGCGGTPGTRKRSRTPARGPS